MASKRSMEEASSSNSAPPTKKLMTQFEPIKLDSVSTLEELDMKVLQFQNKKLAERIEQRRKAEDELKKRIEQLEQRQSTDDAVLCIVNRYWNQLDEDVRVLLQRFDAEGADESGKKNESPAVTSFLMQLSQWDKQEIEEKLRQRVEFSKRAIGKLLQAYDRLLQRNQKLWDAVKQKNENDKKTQNKDVKKESDTESPEIKTEVKEETKEESKPEVKPEVTSEIKSEEEEPADNEKPQTEATVKVEQEKPKVEEEPVEQKPLCLSDEVIEDMDKLLSENTRLQIIATELHQKHHDMTLSNSDLSDRVVAAETEAAELKNQVEELEYNLGNANNKIEKLDRYLFETLGKLNNYQEGEIKVQGGGEGVSKNKFNEILHELEEQREMATNRLTELEKLQKDHQDLLEETERLKMDLSTLPEHVIVETTEYKCLQSQFSVLYNESMQIKTQLEDSRNLIQSSKNNHLRQIEQMEGDELGCQKKLRTELIQLEDQLARVRRDYDMLRIEFEQTLAANEQTGPINREMRNLISSLKNHNHQLKGEIARYKRKLNEVKTENSKLHEMNKTQWRTPPPLCTSLTPRKHAPSTPGLELRAEQQQLLVSNDHQNQQSQLPSQPQPSQGSSQQHGTVRDDAPPQIIPLDDITVLKDEEEDKDADKDSEKKKEKDRGRPESDVIRDLKAELKKSIDRERELKLLLDMYKSSAKESRDKVQLMVSEKRAKQEIDDLRNHIRKMQEAEKKERRKLAEDDAIRKIKKLEETFVDQQAKLTAQKQEEEALLNEMEVTGQAFEDMQEQNIRLLQQLREKDDANFKLMSERIKSNQIQKILREEKDTLYQQVDTLQEQVNAQNQVVRKLEGKEQILQNNLATVEKELGLRQQGMEVHKRKAVESGQTAADLKLHLDKYHTQLKEAQNAVTDKTTALQQQTYKYKRIQEEVVGLRRKLERVKKIEMASSADEVLLEEIREHKEQLTCPSCKVKKKDAVLTKCFHVFCLDCLKARYESRQRKCPKCNAAFGANDYHRIYLDV